MSDPIVSLISWLRGLFRRPAELLEFFGSVATIGWVTLAWHRGQGALPSIDLLSALMPERSWLWIAGLSSALQLAALLANWPALRFCASIMVGSWYAILALAVFEQLGGHPTIAIYGVLAAMNAYVVLHVLEGRMR